MRNVQRIGVLIFTNVQCIFAYYVFPCFQIAHRYIRSSRLFEISIAGYICPSYPKQLLRFSGSRSRNVLPCECAWFIGV